MTWRVRAGAALLALLGLTVLTLGSPAMAYAAPGDDQWHIGYLHIRQAQQISQGEGVTVAVIDSGVDAGHPDLAGSVLPGIDLQDPAYSPIGQVDKVGHGTRMAGLIAAHGKTLGIAPKAKILPIRATGDSAGPTRHYAEGINYAVAHGASVINISLGTSQDEPDVRAAIAHALASNVVVVAAAGNLPETATVEYPAAYPGVIAVTGVDQQGQHAAFSATGLEAVLSAPAVDIYSLWLRISGPGYDVKSGTSDASAIVAGVAALVRSKYPDLSAAQVVSRLIATAHDVDAPGRDDRTGYGIVDPVRALTASVWTLSAAPTVSAIGAAPSSTHVNWTATLLIGLTVLLLAGAGFAVFRARRAA
jgi:type VII secretion-associated serine protease mycosin